jgi:hypothetical protein
MDQVDGYLGSRRGLFRRIGRAVHGDVLHIAQQ